MSKVATGLQDGVKLLELFGGSRKKTIFLWLPNPDDDLPKMLWLADDQPQVRTDALQTVGVLQEDLSPVGAVRQNLGKVALGRLDRVEEVLL